ncbi:MAG: hypothetical protein V2A61_07360, partial [Calditrichota bacterium]
MRTRQLLTNIVLLTLFTLSLLGCSKADDEFRNGQYWLNKENNWQMAARAYRRALGHAPKKWKYHAALLNALSRGEEPGAYEQQLRVTLSFFPDSTRAMGVYNPSVSILGDERYNRIASSYALNRLGSLIAKKKDDTKLLSMAVMAACRNKDSIAVASYFERLLKALKNNPVPDSVIQEMNFFVGSAHVEWLCLQKRIENDPNDLKSRLTQIDLGIISGDSVIVRKSLTDLSAEALSDEQKTDLARRCGMAVGSNPFKLTPLVKGWDGVFAPDGQSIVYIKEMGDQDRSDLYLYRASAKGGSDAPIMKAAQEFLAAIAWPTFSPDSEWIYFYGSSEKGWGLNKPGRFHLYRIRPQWGSHPQKLTDTNLLPVEPGYESSGTVLLVRRDIGSVRSSIEIIRLRPGTKTLESVSRIGEPVSAAAFTPNGDSLLFVTDRGLFRRAVGGGNITVDLTWTGFPFMQISPDGSSLILTTPQGKQILLDRTTVKPTFLGTSGSTPISIRKDGVLLITRGIPRQVCRLELKNAQISWDSFQA